MKDIWGKELSIGDIVVFAKNNYLFTGEITKFYKNTEGKDECSIQGYTQIYSHIQEGRILKNLW